MAVITDPDQLTTDLEVTFNTTTYQITLNNGSGVLDDNGINMGILYSFAKEEWKNNASLIAHPFPFNAIDTDAGKFEIGYNGSEYNDWTWNSDATRKLIRQAGWVEYQSASGSTPVAEYAGVATLGQIDSTSKTVGDKAYYYFSSQSAATEFTYAGPVDEAVQIYGDATHGNVNYKSDVLTVAIRIYDKLYGQSTTTAIGKTVKAQLLTFAVAENSDDLNVNNTDVTADAYGVTITYGAVQRTVDGTAYNFSVVIDGNNRTRFEIYEAVQSALRKTTDIDAGVGTQIGLLADPLLTFVGSTLVTSTGVFIDNIQSTDQNDIQFYDNVGTLVEYPYVAAGTISFNTNLVNDGSAKYWMYYTSSFGTASPLLVLKADGVTPITGNITGASVTYDYDYTNDTNGGGAGIDKGVTIVAIGLNNAQYVLTSGTITASKTNNFSLVASLERNYSNPV